jgi:hypothetical protein
MLSAEALIAKSSQSATATRTWRAKVTEEVGSELCQRIAAPTQQRRAEGKNATHKGRKCSKRYSPSRAHGLPFDAGDFSISKTSPHKGKAEGAQTACTQLSDSKQQPVHAKRSVRLKACRKPRTTCGESDAGGHEQKSTLFSKGLCVARCAEDEVGQEGHSWEIDDAKGEGDVMQQGWTQTQVSRAGWNTLKEVRTRLRIRSRHGA